jgi:hypothetical protein
MRNECQTVTGSDGLLHCSMKKTPDFSMPFATYSDGLTPKSDGTFQTRHSKLFNDFMSLCRVVTGSDGILHYSPLRARDQVNLLTRHYPSLPSLFGARG